MLYAACCMPRALAVCVKLASDQAPNNKAEFVISKLDFLINWARKGSLWYS